MATFMGQDAQVHFGLAKGQSMDPTKAFLGWTSDRLAFASCTVGASNEEVYFWFINGTSAGVRERRAIYRELAHFATIRTLVRVWNRLRILLSSVRFTSCPPSVSAYFRDNTALLRSIDFT